MRGHEERRESTWSIEKSRSAAAHEAAAAAHSMLATDVRKDDMRAKENASLHAWELFIRLLRRLVS